MQEYRDSTWKTDVEFQRYRDKLTKIAAVLVLDVSTSLGSDFSEIRNYALAFVDSIRKNSSSDSKVGVVAFSTKVTSLPLTPIQSSDINTFIRGLAQDQYTALYLAMATGLDMFDGSGLDGYAKSLVTFTDGSDNYSGTTTEAAVQTLIAQSGVQSFTVGLRGKGNLDEDALKAVATRESYQFANSIDDVEKIFRLFSTSVTDVYNLRRVRNDQPITRERIRFRIVSREKC